MSIANALNSLRFIDFPEKGQRISNYWSVNPSGDWAKDCETGREYARLTIEVLSKEDRPFLLRNIMTDIAARNTSSGIEAGFHAELFDLAARGFARAL